MTTLKQRFAELSALRPEISQADLARATGAKPPSVNAWFSGDTKSVIKKCKNIEKSSVYLLLKSKVCLIIQPMPTKTRHGQQGIDQQPTSALTTQRPQINHPEIPDSWQPPQHRQA